MRVLHIDVTAEDIANGQLTPVGCPIALALRRVTGEVWTVSSMDVARRARNFDLPREARYFVDNFDRHRDVAPFSFELSVDA